MAAAALLSLTAWSGAQTRDPVPPPAVAPEALAPVVVTGNPLASKDIAAPVSVLAGDALVLRRGNSLGDTLNALPGVSSTYFGPNANRPIIRGLDGDRVRLMGNGGQTLDASGLSFDHAVPIDPLIVDRVEVIRGPGALLYGGNAVGGVVNAIDNRIPRQPLSALGGAAELRLGGAEAERGGAAVLEGGQDRLAWHADVFGRNTDDLRVPRFEAPTEEGEPAQSSTRVRNSASRTRGGALGGSWFFEQGRVGLSVDTYDSRYGVVAEPDVTIDMKRDHLALAAEHRDLGGVLPVLRLQASQTRYQHQEIEGSGAVGTDFRSDGSELRVEAEHAPLGPLRGVLGAQWEDFDFSALGEEAFVPTTHTRRLAVFGLEEWPWSAGTFNAGLRLEQARVASDGDADPAEVRFGAARSREFNLRTASIAQITPLNPQWTASATWAYTERAPMSYELFAQGVHAATGVFERGDDSLQKERGANLDLALTWKRDGDHWRVGVFSSRFARFIALDATGATVPVVDEDGATRDLPEFAYRASRARLHGLEVEGRQQLLRSAAGLWRFTGKLDLTRGTQVDRDEPLPRIAPLRWLAGLEFEQGAWSARAEVDHADRQDRVPSTDQPTDGYTVVNLSLARRWSIGGNDALGYLKLGNVTNQLAYNAATIQTVRGLSPLPGRALKAGLRVAF